MFTYKQDVEAGKKILHTHGIRYSCFKATAAGMLWHSHKITEDDWVKYFNHYALTVSGRGFCTPEQFTREMFSGRTPGDHEYWLKTDTQ